MKPSWTERTTGWGLLFWDGEGSHWMMWHLSKDPNRVDLSRVLVMVEGSTTVASQWLKTQNSCFSTPLMSGLCSEYLTVSVSIPHPQWLHSLWQWDLQPMLFLITMIGSKELGNQTAPKPFFSKWHILSAQWQWAVIIMFFCVQRTRC